MSDVKNLTLMFRGPRSRHVEFSNILFFPNEHQLGFHMSYHLFLHHGWFVQNLGEDTIPTNMHTTVTLDSIHGRVRLQRNYITVRVPL